MTDDIGLNTQDLHALGQPHPAEQGLTPDQREEATRRHGRRCLITGTSILSALYVVCLAFAVASDNGMATSSNAELFYVLAMMGATITGTTFLSAGLAERRERPNRAMLRQNRADLAVNSRRLDTIMGLVAAVPGRLAVLEDVIEKVPAYGEGVIHGMQMRQTALGPDTEQH